MQSKIPAGDLGFLHTIQTDSGWGKASLIAIGATENDMCDLCGEPMQDTEHNIWNCLALKDERCRIDPELAAINPKYLHKDVKRGIAPAMGTQPQDSYWGGGHPRYAPRKSENLPGPKKSPA